MVAQKAEHDVELAGHQIDVYVELVAADRALRRIAVEAKDYAKPAGIEVVSGFASVVDGLRRLKLIDEGVVVSAAGSAIKPATPPGSTAYVCCSLPTWRRCMPCKRLRR
jgi:hypothetical protein